MYYRVISEDESKYTTPCMAEQMRNILTRATVLLTVFLLAPHLYGIMTGGSLDHLLGADKATWDTIQWALTISVVFDIMGIVGVARMVK